MASLLFRIDPLDPASYSAAATLLLVVVLLATWLPARKAAAIDPADALRRA